MRYLLPILAILALVGGLAAIKADQIGLIVSTGKAAKKRGPPPETVASTRAKKATWGTSLTAIGTVEAGKGVTISNDSPGIVRTIRFESGDEVKAGAVLIELDTSVERAQLASATARLGLAETTLNRTRALAREKVATTAELESAEATLKTSGAEVSALRAQIARKVVLAPFAGRLGIRLVNVGQYLSPGSAITTLQSGKQEYVDFTLPQQFLDELRLGLPVKLSDKNSRVELEGLLAAIDPEVDERTRSVTLRASTSDPKKQLRPGMFVNVAVELDKKREVVMVPATAVVHAPYGDSVFTIESEQKGGHGKVARQQFVRLGETRGDFVEVEKGLTGSELVVSAGAFKLRNGARVTINNDVKPSPQLEPRPPNR